MVSSVNKSHVIGTHIEGFRKLNPERNSASTIGGQYGVPYNALVGVIEEEPLHRSGNVWWGVPFHKKDTPKTKNRKGQQHTSKSRPQPVSSLPHPSTQSRRKEDVYATLLQYKTSFLVDDSASRMDDDPVIGNKWALTKRVMADITTIVAKHNRDGVEVRFFNPYLKPPKGKNLRSAEEVMRLIKKVKPYDESPIAYWLGKVLGEYCDDFEKNRRTKRLKIIVLNNEKPSGDQDFEKIVVQYTRRLKELGAPSLKVEIQFVQIGNDPEATAYFKRLDDNLQARDKSDRDVSEKRAMQYSKD